MDQEWYAIMSIGIFGLIGQVFMTRAFSLEEASVLAPFKYMEIIYALIMGFIFFGEGYQLMAMLGMGDSFFATWFFILEMQTRGIDLLMEQQGARRRVTDFRKGEKLGQRDHLIALAKPKNKPGWMSQSAFDEAPESITVREFKAGGKTMVTTMLCPKVAPKTELKALYKSRWSVELDLRNIKDTLGMNILSCKSPDMVEKEIWVYLLAYNLIRWMMVQSALLADVNPRRLSFKHSLQLWLIAASRMVDCTPEQRQLLLKLVAEQPVANRSGRVEPRAVKRRPKAFPLLTIPRDQARQKVLQYGHPKKLK